MVALNYLQQYDKKYASAYKVYEYVIILTLYTIKNIGSFKKNMQ